MKTANFGKLSVLFFSCTFLEAFCPDHTVEHIMTDDRWKLWQ